MRMPSAEMVGKVIVSTVINILFFATLWIFGIRDERFWSSVLAAVTTSLLWILTAWNISESQGQQPIKER